METGGGPVLLVRTRRKPFSELVRIALISGAVISRHRWEYGVHVRLGGKEHMSSGPVGRDINCRERSWCSLVQVRNAEGRDLADMGRCWTYIPHRGLEYGEPENLEVAFSG